MALRLRGSSTPFLLTDTDSESDGERAASHKLCRNIKSSEIRTSDTHVVKRVKWPHEVVFTSQGKAPVYADMSLALFFNGYLAIMADKKSVPIKDTCSHTSKSCSKTWRYMAGRWLGNTTLPGSNFWSLAGQHGVMMSRRLRFVDIVSLLQPRLASLLPNNLASGSSGPTSAIRPPAPLVGAFQPVSAAEPAPTPHHRYWIGAQVLIHPPKTADSNHITHGPQREPACCVCLPAL